MYTWDVEPAAEADRTTLPEFERDMDDVDDEAEANNCKVLMNSGLLSIPEDECQQLLMMMLLLLLLLLLMMMMMMMIPGLWRSCE